MRQTAFSGSYAEDGEVESQSEDGEWGEESDRGREESASEEEERGLRSPRDSDAPRAEEQGGETYGCKVPGCTKERSGLKKGSVRNHLQQHLSSAVPDSILNAHRLQRCGRCSAIGGKRIMKSHASGTCPRVAQSRIRAADGRRLADHGPVERGGPSEEGERGRGRRRGSGRGGGRVLCGRLLTSGLRARGPRYSDHALPGGPPNVSVPGD